jgi:pterin-4a-carbinolamine dehydratase
MMMAKDLLTKKYQPCSKSTVPFSFEEAKSYLAQVPNWSLSQDGKSISREFLMKDFLSAIQLMNQIAGVAEAEDYSGC